MRHHTKPVNNTEMRREEYEIKNYLLTQNVRRKKNRDLRRNKKGRQKATSLTPNDAFFALF